MTGCVDVDTGTAAEVLLAVGVGVRVGVGVGWAGELDRGATRLEDAGEVGTAAVGTADDDVLKAADGGVPVVEPAVHPASTTSDTAASPAAIRLLDTPRR
jgi:hypothetical protein